MNANGLPNKNNSNEYIDEEILLAEQIKAAKVSV